MKFNELSSKSADELKGLLRDLKKEQFNLRFQRATGELASGARMREVRKTVARVMTLLTAKKKES